MAYDPGTLIGSPWNQYQGLSAGSANTSGIADIDTAAKMASIQQQLEQAGQQMRMNNVYRSMVGTLDTNTAHLPPSGNGKGKVGVVIREITNGYLVEHHRSRDRVEQVFCNTLVEASEAIVGIYASYQLD